MLDSPLVWFAIATAPIVTVIFASWFWVRRNPVFHPSIVAAIPLCLSAVAILLARSAYTLLQAFNEIANRKTAGVGAVIDGLRNAQAPLAWVLAECAACIAFIFLISAFLRFSRDAETPLIHAYITLPALVITTVFLGFLLLMAVMQYRTVDLVMMIVDKHRLNEISAQYGSVDPGYFAARISSSFVATLFLSICESIALIAVGIMDLFWRQQRSGQQVFAAILTVGALLCCAVGALEEFGFLDYLQHVR